MKSFFIFSILFVGLSVNAFSQNINTPENFPDPNFRAAVEEFMGVTSGGEFSAAEASKKDGTLDCSERGIKDFTGLELFPALIGFDCGNNPSTNLDVSNNTALTKLYCALNQLTSLDVSNNLALTHFWCGINELTSLDISNNLALTQFRCGINELTSLDVSNNTALTSLECWNNQLTSLDVSNNTALTSLECWNNQLTSLDVSNNTALTSLECWNNQLTSLDVSNNTSLKSLSCSENQLTSFDVSGAIALEWLECGDNQLTSLSSLVANEGLGEVDYVDVRNNYIGCVDPDTAMSDIQILTARIGEAVFNDWGELRSGFAFEPQNECETAVLDWSLH